MLDYKKEYRRWLTSDALSAGENFVLGIIYIGIGFRVNAKLTSQIVEHRHSGFLLWGCAARSFGCRAGLQQYTLNIICFFCKNVNRSTAKSSQNTFFLP